MQIDDGQIRRVTFDRPAQKNAMTGAVARELADAVGTVEANTHDAVLITGRGDAFSAGGDIEAMAALGTLGEQPTANIGLAKQAIHDNLGRGWRDGLAHEAHVQSLAYDTPAHERGVEAFLAGDSPEFDDL